MDKKIGIIITVVIIGLVAATYGLTPHNKTTIIPDNTVNKTLNNTLNSTELGVNMQKNQSQSNKGNINEDYDIVIDQKGPYTSQKGTLVPIDYTITNNGKNTVYEIKVWSQLFDQYVGTLEPGQTKKYTYKQYIPTDEEVKSEIGEKLPNTLIIGGIYLSFEDYKHSYHRIQSNPIDIKLH